MREAVHPAFRIILSGIGAAVHNAGSPGGRGDRPGRPARKPQKSPSDRPDTVVAASPVSIMASQSPGKRTVSIREKRSGSFAFTHASFAAVKFPGEFSIWVMH